MNTLFKMRTIGLSTTILFIIESKDSVLPEFLYSWQDLTLHSVLEFIIQVEELLFQMFFHGTKHMEIAGRHIQGGWSSCFHLNLPLLACVTLDTCGRALSWTRTTPSVSSSCLLFLVDLHRLWIVSQYISEVMVPLCLRNSINSGPWASKKTVSNTLPTDSPEKWGLHDPETDVKERFPYSVPLTGTK